MIDNTSIIIWAAIVDEKLQKYIGFSITELDRQIKTSSEKNSQDATKDL